MCFGLEFLWVHTDYTLPFELTYFFPHAMAVVFLVFLYLIHEPTKVQIFCRALLAVLTATVLAHVDRWFNLWPAHPYFASGHMTFTFGLAVSAGLLRPWTLAISLPLLVPFGVALYFLGFHTPFDILGAIPLVFAVYGTIHGLWRIAPVPPPLDMAPDSP